MMGQEDRLSNMVLLLGRITQLESRAPLGWGDKIHVTWLKSQLLVLCRECEAWCLAVS